MNNEELSSVEQYNQGKQLISKGIRKAIQDMAITPSGKLFFRWMMSECGFHASSITYSDNRNLDKDGLLINEVLRRFYINIRKHIPSHILPDIEFMDVHKYIIEELKVEKGEKK